MSTSKPLLVPGAPAVLVRSFPGAARLGELAQALSASQPHMVWLDSARVHRRIGRFSILGWDPWLLYSSSALPPADGLNVTAPQPRTPLEALSQILSCHPGPRGHGLPPAGLGFFVLLGYELGGWIERLPAPKPAHPAVPLLCVFGMRRVVVVDHLEERTWCLSLVDPSPPAAQGRRSAQFRLEAMEALLRACQAPQEPDLMPAESAIESARPAVEASMRQGEFEAMVRSAKASIADGEIFQANLAHQMTAPLPASPWALYAALRRVNPSPFAGYLQTPEFALVSCSPERLVEVRDGVVSARPIAGTRPRGGSPEQDALNGLELMLSEKERAEHIMLVDLARNDLGRVCRAGSVEVDELMALEEYSHVMHIVSNVRGRLRPGAGPADVIRAVFPGGTITGCPKIRAMQIIGELEPSARGAYTGSMGMIGFDGSMDLNILIRTFVASGERLWFHVGAGIVADSRPDREYHETLAKAGALILALQEAGARAPSARRPCSSIDRPS